MRICILSDTHNDQNQTKRALARLQQEGIDTILHAGDVTSARMLDLFKDYSLWIAQGNMDRDPGLAPKVTSLFGAGRLKHHHTLQLNGKHLALIHNGESTTAHDLVRTKSYDYLVHGHSHQTRDERIMATRIINPGALGNTRWQRPSFAILDLTTDDLSFIKL